MFRKASRKATRARHPWLTGIAGGLLAGAVVGGVDRLLDWLVSEEQQRRDRQVREAPGHQVAGPLFARKILRRPLTEQEKQRAQKLFGIAYGVMWGLIHAGLRKKAPQLSRWAGVPLGLPFFAACDGVMAPLLRVNPPLQKIPWQMSAKELANHVAWTATTEMVQRMMVKRARP